MGAKKEVKFHLLGYSQNKYFTVFPCIPQGSKNKDITSCLKRLCDLN